MSQIPLIEELGDPQARRDDDFYETPRWQLEALLRRVEFPEWPRVLEPCAGNGAIAAPLCEAHPLHVWANDLVERDYALDSHLDATKAESWARIRTELGPVDAVITNLPFYVALSILEHAVEACGFVATILRRTWDEPTVERATGRDRGEWLAAHPCTGQIVLPRHSYRGEGSDSATTAWFIWERGHRWLNQPFDVVTKQERDTLIARFGKD